MSTNSVKYVRKMKKHEKISLWAGRVFIWFAILLVLFPVFWIVTASLRTGDAFFSSDLLPKEITFDNYINVFKETGFATWIKNSVVIASCVASLQLLMSITSAYAFSRMRFKGRKYGLMSLLILQMFPAMMTLAAIYGILYKYDLIDNKIALILILSGGSAYNIWLLKGFIDGIPKALDEAAMVDGASHWQIFTKIILPLSRSMLAVIFLFSFIGIYSEFVISSVALKSPENYTLAIGLNSFIKNEFAANWTQFAAAAIMGALPVVGLFVALQKYIAKGLVAGAVKG
ncbi:sugar ABC transporter permease [Oceanirhabdus sp. W0125-5]|uniref:sugar ABC transporter permease n=1 Tax=Oceanirhabdus sp. W0125-5 TaxID=2999116 RepID=UPI0022F2B5AA|nr:sugar ABC transporter permease [Oceanirhabdus sp. W0125-5]WBW95510.1 sugar ABC transporter permease [Oceanirhabdus sp. W0125-5]